MKNKRYTMEQAAKLLGRLAALDRAPIARVRRVLEVLIDARLSDVLVSPIDVVVTDEQIANLRRAVGTYLMGMTETRSRQGPWLPVTLKNVTLTLQGTGEMEFHVAGEVGTLVTLQVVALLRLVGDRLRQCECGTLYVRKRRQTFCSTRCQKRYYMRRFRAGEAGRE